MNATMPMAGPAENRAVLIAALDRLAALLHRDPNVEAGETVAPFEPAPDSALALLCARFNLGAFERDVLLLAAAPELDGRFPALFAQAAGDAARVAPTLSLALSSLPEATWTALRPQSPLRYWRLIEIEGPSLVTSPIRIDEHILHALLGFPFEDRRLRTIRSSDGTLTSSLSDSAYELASAIVALWHRADATGVQIVSTDAAHARLFAAHVAARVASEPIFYRLAYLPVQQPELDDTLLLCARELAITGALGVLECDETPEFTKNNALERFVDRIALPHIVLTPAPVAFTHTAVPTFTLRRATRTEQQAQWESALSGSALVERDIAALAAQFDLDFATIATIGTSLPPKAVRADVWERARTQSRPRLDALAQRIETNAGWRDLVIPKDQRRLMRQIVDHVRQRDIVYREWGFSGGADNAEGLTVLFSGASGTGKSLAARVIANTLALDLYRVDLAGVFSKYIGETEKNLRAIFDAAESGGVVLLFDEADALFGKRSEVSDSHDRHANVEVSYLLQRLERFNGVAVLTTNMRDAFDVAFMRRFRFVIDFPFPDVSIRARIWKRAFPPQTPLDDIDVTLLAKLAVAGGNIRNIALNAAVHAAAKSRAVTMNDIASAVKMEFAKLDRSLHDPDLTRWLEAIPERVGLRAVV